MLFMVFFGFFYNTVDRNSANTINSDIVGFSSIGLFLKIHWLLIFLTVLENEWS